MLDEFKEDLARYRAELHSVFHEPSIVVVFFYRFRTGLYPKLPRLVALPIKLLVEPLYFLLTLLFGIHLPKGARIGGGLMIFHTGGIVLHHQAVLGRNCTLRHNVTIGVRHGGGDVPVLGDNVNIGTGAVILGAIRIGDNTVIGANAVVLCDVPDGCMAVGNPARILARKSTSQAPGAA